MLICAFTMPGMKTLSVGFLLLLGVGVKCKPLNESNADIKENPLLISAFNIRTFGRAKMDDLEVVAVLQKILVRYDMVLVQEIRDNTFTAIYELLDILNEDNNDPYEIVLSDRLGTTSYKEQYAFFYKPSKFTYLDTHQWPEDGGKMFERPPFTVRFRAENYEVGEFGFMGIHVKPDDAPKEIDLLVDVYNQVSADWGLEDILIGGDFNAGCRYVTESEWEDIRLKHDERFMWVIGDDVDTTITDTVCPYDRLVLAGNKLQTAYLDKSATAYNFRDEQGLNDDLTERTSDHWPVDMQLM